MRIWRRRALLLLAWTIALAAEEASMQEQILGSWEASGTVYSGGPGQAQTGGIGWYKRYVFHKDGTYTFDAYPPLQGKGKWTIVAEGGLHILVLTSVDADGREQEASRATVSVSENTLALGSAEFKRVPAQ